MHAVAAGAYSTAAKRLRRLIPQLPQIGGSRAQNELFLQIHDWCCESNNETQSNAIERMAAA